MEITKQQVFDAAWNGLKAQGFEQASTNPWNGGICQFETFNGKRRCAWGHANYAFCGDAAATQVIEYFDWESRFVYQLRECHNDATSPADMERRLREFAKAEGLTVPGEPDAFQAFMAKVQEPVDTKVPDSIVLKNGVRFVQYDD